MPIHRRQFIYLAAGCGVALGAGCQRLSRASMAQSQSEPAQSKPVQSELAPSELAPSELAQSEPAEPLQRDPKSQVRIVVISDLNSQYGSTTYDPEVDQAIQLIPSWKPDLVLCGGDMVAGQKRELSDAQVRAMWAAFDRHIRAPLAQANIPLGFTLGNHDGSGALRGEVLSFERDRNLARDYWNNPAHDPGLNFIDRTHFPFYYTFQQNGIFYLSWDASTATISEAQLTWVERSLSSKLARSAKLRMALGHLPLYPVAVGRDRPGEFLDGGEALRSRLEHHRVHTYISGHNHAYYPGFRGQLDLLHTGAIGSGPRQLIGSPQPAQKTLTLVDIAPASGQAIYTTYILPSLTHLNPAILPAQIQGTSVPDAPITRRDLRP